MKQIKTGAQIIAETKQLLEDFKPSPEQLKDPRLVLLRVQFNDGEEYDYNELSKQDVNLPEVYKDEKELFQTISNYNDQAARFDEIVKIYTNKGHATT